jgi:hypothetical protein
MAHAESAKSCLKSLRRATHASNYHRSPPRELFFVFLLALRRPDNLGLSESAGGEKKMKLFS